MSGKPVIAVAIPTWPRNQARLIYLERTLEAMEQNATVLRHEFQFVASAECEDVSETNREGFFAICRRFDVLGKFRMAPPNLGDNMNAALDLAGELADAKGSELVAIILLQDDWRLHHKTNFSLFADFLEEERQFAMIRFEWSTNPAHTLIGPTVAHRNQRVCPIRLMDPRSAYFYADHPHMRRGTYEKEFGQYKAGSNLGFPEVELTGRLKASAWQIGTSELRLFSHIGEFSSVTEAERMA